MTPGDSHDPDQISVAGAKVPRQRSTFSQDFSRFFIRGLAALLPTLITVWLLFKVWDFLWNSLGQHIIFGLKQLWLALGNLGIVPQRTEAYIEAAWGQIPGWLEGLIGVSLAVILIYIVGVVVGNLIGRTAWRLAEMAVMRIPLVRAIYPAVKQVTEFVLSDRTNQFAGSAVVAVQPHEKGIWSIGLVTGPGLRPLSQTLGEDMVTVFVPSSPTAFSGYVLVVPRASVIELPMTVEEAMRLLISGGVLGPEGKLIAPPTSKPVAPQIEKTRA